MIVGTMGTAFAATVPLTLSAASGPSGGGNTITATATTNIFTTATTPAVEFQYVGTGAAASCSATYLAPAAIAPTTAPTGTAAYVQTAGVIAVPPANVKKLGGTNTNKISVTVPAGLALANTGGGTPTILQSTAKYNLCVYSGTTVAATGVTGSPLIGNAAYTIAGKPTITGVSPATGPALGGTTITVTGTNFPSTGMTGTLGGTALTNIVVASGGTSFTATAPAHAAQTGVSLIINSAGGIVTQTAAYDYTNGVVISPNTAAPSSTVDVDVQGVGFLAPNFTTSDGTTPNDTNAHVYLVSGAYDPTPDTTVNTNKANPEVAECVNVLVVSDTELICTLVLTGSIGVTGAPAAATPVKQGTYTLTVVTDGRLDVQTGGANAASAPDYDASLITSGATFTVSPY
ncbi:IPT/TIG domain-containing protein [Dactylosporangium sp. CA-052675]|uniref:IPT/TIG domain-containing protein n=1 Tax=Dactylosporangium sp. CA-052675 TaxID=3239927 RepID=UPI003D92F4E5